MNPYTLFPLTAQRASAITGPIDEDLSVAVYKVIDGVYKAIGAVAKFAGAIAGAIRKWHRRNEAVRELSMLSAPGPRRATRPHLVAANPPARSARAAPANDNQAGLAA